MFQLYGPSLAYKLLALYLMVGEANFFVKQLDLPLPHPIEPSELVQVYANPGLLEGMGFLGNIKTTNYAFGFFEGHLGRVYKRHTEDFLLTQAATLAKTPSLIDTNGAYQLATQWLTAVSIDVNAMEKKYKVNITSFEIERRVLPREARDKRWWATTQQLPVFYVKWGEGQYVRKGTSTSTPAAEVQILGTRKELLELSVNDDALSKRAPLFIANTEEINSLPNGPVEELLKKKPFDYARFFDLLSVPSPYKVEVQRLMSGEAEVFARAFNLPVSTPIQSADLAESYVRPPPFGFGGNIRSGKFNFRFNESGKLYAIRVSDYFSDNRPSNPPKPLLLDTNSAYQLATQWLAAVSVDIAGLERKHPPIVRQESNPGRKGVRTYLPNFTISWSEYPDTALEITIHGITKRLEQVKINDTSYLQRPRLMVTNAETVMKAATQ